MLARMNFNRALIISFLWHLFCFFTVTIIIVPVGTIQGKPSDIYFLGPILDEKEFRYKEQNLGTAPSARQKRLQKPLLENEGPSARERKEPYPRNESLLGDKPAISPLDKLIRTEKATADLKHKSPDAALEINNFDVVVSQQRAVVFKPPLSEYDESLSDTAKGIAGLVKLKVIITPEGTVKGVENLQTSGYPEIDLAAIRHVKKWRFQPLSPDKPQQDQEQIIEFEFK